MMPIETLPHLTARQDNGFKLLDGVRVVDLTTSIAGPYASLLLADYGAEIIKVESPLRGDDARAWGPPFINGQSLWFLSVNRNKQSLTVDLVKEEGQRLLYDLIKQSDVFIANFLPKVSKKLGLDPQTVRELNPQIIYISITGFGSEGERANWPCYDLIAEGYSGIMDLTGELDGEPQKIGAPAADMLAGMDAATAATAALYDRQRSGEGKIIDISLVNSMARFLAPRIMTYLGSGTVPRRSGGKDSVIAIYQSFNTADLPMTLGLGNDNIWRRFWECVGRREYGLLLKYASNADRREYREEIVTEIQNELVKKPRDEWLILFSEARVPAGPINRIDEVVQDKELQRQYMFYSLDDDENTYPQIGTGVMIDGKYNTPRSRPPKLGEHTDKILSQLLNYSVAQINTLKDKKVI
jgi:crotonobetainyl-CoA:carnitine CoA-transferase CaiB-like acyl-CoA transferase